MGKGLERKLGVQDSESKLHPSGQVPAVASNPSEVGSKW